LDIIIQSDLTYPYNYYNNVYILGCLTIYTNIASNINQLSMETIKVIVKTRPSTSSVWMTSPKKIKIDP